MNQQMGSKSVIRCLSPITKGILCIGFILMFSIFCKMWLVAFNLNLFIILLCFYLKEDAIGLIVSLKRIWFLLLFFGLFQGFVGKSFDLFASLNAIFKIMGIYLTATLYTRISPQNELLYFWEICFKPLKLFGLSSNELALTMVIAIRFMPVFIDEIDRIRIAQIARGAKLTRNSIVSAINFMPLLIPILTQAIRRSEELADAMEVRGYVADRPRGRYKSYKLCGYDYLAFLIMFITLALLVWKMMS